MIVVELLSICEFYQKIFLPFHFSLHAYSLEHRPSIFRSILSFSSALLFILKCLFPGGSLHCELITLNWWDQTLDFTPSLSLYTFSPFQFISYFLLFIPFSARFKLKSIFPLIVNLYRSLLFIIRLFSYKYFMF